MSQKRSTKTASKTIISSKNNQIRIRYDQNSPRVIRIKASKISVKNIAEHPVILNSNTTPKPKNRISTLSPFIPQSNSSFSKLNSLHKTNTHRISSKFKKDLNKTAVVHKNLSNSMLPPPQDFKFFVSHLLDIFFSAESVTDYFFIKRKKNIDLEQFLESCFSLGLNVFFSDLEKIFEEVLQEGCHHKAKFFKKILSVQNCDNGNKTERSKKKHTLSSIMNKIMVNEENSTKKMLGIIKDAKNNEDLLGKIQTEVSNVDLSKSELTLLMDYSKVHKTSRERNKKNLNLTTKINGSPYAIIPCSIGYTKNL